MAVGVNIAKANLAVTSHPPSRVAVGKVNVAVTSHPLSRVAIGKVNFAVNSRDEIPPAPSGRRRTLFVS
jgi:hypothetical protein